MRILPHVIKCGKLLAVSACILALHACNGVIYDGEGDCSVNYRVRFRYDYNMKFADAFAREVNSVTLYLLDNNGKVVWQRTEQGDRLASPDYAMTVDNVPTGEYSLLAWCGTTDKKSFSIPQTDIGTDLTCTLRRNHTADGEAFTDQDLDRLFHGWLPLQCFCETEGDYTYTVPLVKNTNHVQVVLQHLSGEPMDKDRFEFSIRDNNGSMDWDNRLMPDEPVTYYAWHTAAGEAGMAAPASKAAFSAVIAELTVPRLVKGQDPRLTVTDRESGKTVFSIPLIDYALLVKGFYNRDMDDQEYLDRQDEYNMIFFLDERDRWLDSYIYINSWKVVLQDTGL